MAMERVKQLVSHMSPASKGVAALQRKSPDDVVITMAVRSPLCRAKGGGFMYTKSDELLAEMFKQAIAHSGIDPALVGDITVGTVLSPSATYEARTAALAAGFPESVPVQTINRFCSSGLMAVTDISNKIRAGQIEVGLAVGMESMSQNPDKGAPASSDSIKANQAACDSVMPMGWTSENVAGDFNISRQEMDEWASISFQRAEHADKSGYFANEIVPFTAYEKPDPETGKRATKVVSKDDGIRAGTTAEKLLKIRPAFPQWKPSQTTGGNASQITDGTAAVLLMTRRKAEELGLAILAKHVTTAVAGLAPRVMGIGPSIAIPQVLQQAGITTDDVDLFEASGCAVSYARAESSWRNADQRGVRIDDGVLCAQAGSRPCEVEMSNCADGLGASARATGARQIATGLNELARRKGKILVTSMCIGTGMGAASVFVGE
ncbi:uncharacterized protein FIBRA_05234 [Fibroporia radiculosa]|uniref:Thiolase N-terminal domain-containing protein n=1 Tax=Fibroporia radiculosa TaxID=599839 RepID=J4G8V4_9APHY|nr:uncharacterized protein FIBRA_05234 [Fibroporia radiculosa]CCM03113.1 predicted protein [Fibroporia radiculosa]